MPPTNSLELLEQKWVQAHGEAITYAEACTLLSVSKPTIGRLVRAGHLHVTPTKRVLVRSAAAWANGCKKNYNLERRG